ncbi:3'-5' exoribonuclease YhaM family protein [Clostridium algidicarnis]|uniref:HD domain-containing protein n=1 Tax=Clostridium algidicarnis TaxID=37659 RepID=A0ABS6C5U0_9CLOT|nr:HD domain-containing protein [Clostridium algidicarnis]MBB6632220.1 HD domain-containing protein [Clostridium algidicarnis]MBB6698446.1 HD domain-containing protein [Clostridium algidicarnis]MBU3197334.1 HD domain-containing protein [Clostridium algidicarnis]MBU3207656.1 HD domain-containing protein [Clostridium algidicarnis]MBU3220855.1 HD domain-containing protein [Clostridium algidicarnis]
MIIVEVNNISISDFEPGAKIEGYYMIRAVDTKTTNSNNKKYLDFSLCDKTGEINAKLWEVPALSEDKYKGNTVVKIKGSILSWQGALQLKIERIRNINDEDKINVEDFVQAAPLKPEFMYDEILGYINNMEDKDIKDIVKYIFEENKEKLQYYPAAKKNHHAIRSGLLFHVMTMIHMAEKLSEIYTFLNKDLLYAGVILHDMSKIEEMNSNDFGIVDEYTVEGQLLGHITQGVKNIEVVAEKLGTNKEVSMLLQHLVLSHHYEPEYGSPVKPMIAEAEMLHYLDIVDARMYDIKKVLKDTEKGNFSERLWSLENRRIYNPKL